MIKKMLDNLFNLSADQFETVAVSVWSNIKEILFPDK